MAICPVSRDGRRVHTCRLMTPEVRTTDAASRYAQVLADLAKTGLRVVVIESRDEELVTVKTARGIHVFTIGRELALEGGLLKRPLRSPPVKQEQ
ncbi:hypothetical protein [Paraburkholderia sp. SIMBA_030]|uniref:hypothetical protein n=1 Tax=Paraburkholderia sp. SIMBA_030 TaxID=3085773 RepID=UPI003978A547